MKAEKKRDSSRLNPNIRVWSQRKRRRLLAELEKLEQGTTDPATPFVQELYHWERQQVVEHRLKPSTINEYKRCVGVLARHLGDVPVGKVSELDIDYAIGSVSDGSRHSVYSVLSAAVHWLEDQGRCHLVAMLPRRKPPSRKSERFMSDGEYRALGSALDIARLEGWAAGDLVDAVSFAVDVPVRAGEVCTLTWDETDLDAQVLHLRDTKSGDRKVPLPQRAVEMIRCRPRRHVDDDGRRRVSPYVFTVPWAPLRPMSRLSVSHAFKRICRRHGQGLETLRFHDLRHSWASKAIRSGVPMEHVRRILGHSTQWMTERYAHLADPTLRRAIQLVEDSIYEGTAAQLSLPGIEKWGPKR